MIYTFLFYVRSINFAWYQSPCQTPTSRTTTTNMLADCCDVMVAHSPPLFTPHSSQSELSVLYQNLRLVMTQKQQQSPLSMRRLNRPSNLSNTEDRAGSPNKPRRPCLVTRSDSDGSIGSSSGSSSDENEPTSPTKSKKKVVFADDRGLSLTQVRLMNEPSNQPPKLMGIAPYLNQSPSVLQSTANNPKQSDQWQLRFPQPASSYLDFRKRLDESGVSLENVIVKSQDRRIVGTVKVRNLSYDKEVFVRCTHDKWATFEDTLCTYVQNNTISSNSTAGSAQNVTAIYDTFSFRLTLPGNATSMEFAVCYKGGDFEYWDNNDGANYCLINNNQVSQTTSPSPMLSPSPTLIEFEQKSPVPFFGDQSRQNSWSSIWREQKSDTYTTY
ncbi:protein phosphatase 1 regulatory subunit 3B-like isoform X2 [Daktulosphaira vitifoliae]|nr:protein phosphatase 1 regulatory subunit 3B-like isoform X2 [Daktulosphaira vitifoliae]